MYSTILSWEYDVGAMRELIEPISNFRTENPFHQSGDTGDYMAQHIFLLRDMPLALQNQIVEATPLPLNVEEHSVAIETVKADKKVNSRTIPQIIYICWGAVRMHQCTGRTTAIRSRT